MIPEYIRENFETLRKAFINHDACLLEVTDEKGDFKYIICTYHSEPAEDNKTEVFQPIARIFEFTKEDNPYKLFKFPE